MRSQDQSANNAWLTMLIGNAMHILSRCTIQGTVEQRLVIPLTVLIAATYVVGGGRGKTYGMLCAMAFCILSLSGMLKLTGWEAFVLPAVLNVPVLTFLLFRDAEILLNQTQEPPNA